MTRHISRIVSITVAIIALCAGFAAAAQTQCTDCGRVQAIRFVEEEGRGTGVGAVAGGAYVGNKVEQNKNKKAYWTVTLRMDGGTTRTFTYSNPPTVKEGERVKLVDGGKRLALLAN